MTSTTIEPPSTANALIKTVFWLFVLTVAVQFVGIIFMTMSDVLSLFIDQKLPLEQYDSNPYLLFLMTFFWALCAAPLIKYALGENSPAPLLQRLAFNPINSKPLILTIIASFVYMLIEYYISDALDVKTPDFMINYAQQLYHWYDIVIAFVSISILAPLIEEVIFRGVAYSRLINTRLGTVGAIVIPSIFFTLVHMQYEQITVFVFIFISSVLFGLMRHFTQNIWYCIIAHMLMNTVALISIL